MNRGDVGVRSRLRGTADTGEPLWGRHKIWCVVAAVIILAGAGTGIWAATSSTPKAATTATQTVSDDPPDRRGVGHPGNGR